MPNWQTLILALTDTEKAELSQALAEHYATSASDDPFTLNTHERSMVHFYIEALKIGNRSLRHYINAIKEYRYRTGAGLKEAKEAVAAYRDHLQSKL